MREISIIIATFNRGHFIKDCLGSILKQTFHDWECLIIDDGSTDNTGETVRALVETDNRFKYFRRTSDYKKGLPGCRNMGLDVARGNFIIFFDDDDIVHPGNLETCLSILKKHTSSFFCRYDKKPFTGDYTNLKFEPVKGFKEKRITVKNINQMITGAIPFASCTVLWSSKCFKGIRFNEELMYAEEWECYTRILIKGYEGVSINQVLYYNRKHIESNTGQFRNHNPIQLNSQIKAAKLVIQNLAAKNLFNEVLNKYFVRMGFELNSQVLVMLSLRFSNAGKVKRTSYYIGYYIYPLLKPIFHLKSKIIRI